MKSYFSTQIYQAKIPFDLNDLETEIQQIFEMDLKGRKWSKENYKKGYTSYGSLDQLHKMSSSFEKLEKKINFHVLKLSKNLDYDIHLKKIKMTNCWVNVMPKGAQHASHIHPHSVFSGSYYVSIPKGSSAIKFEDPRLNSFMNAPTVKTSARTQNQRFVSLQPKPGDIILFESWLKHEVPTNDTAQPRISVSFNYGWA
jgi:uncharacterized protein (TIGR02466 family)